MRCNGRCNTQLLGFDPDSLHFVTTCSFPPGSFLGAIQRLFFDVRYARPSAVAQRHIGAACWLVTARLYNLKRPKSQFCSTMRAFCMIGIIFVTGDSQLLTADPQGEAGQRHQPVTGSPNGHTDKGHRARGAQSPSHRDPTLFPPSVYACYLRLARISHLHLISRLSPTPRASPRGRPSARSSRAG